MSRLVRRGPAEWLVVSCGLWHIGLGLYFICGRPALLPEDLRYMGVDAQVLYAAPRLAAWLAKVFTVMGGFMAGTGVLIAYLGWKVMPLRTRGMTAALALTGALTLVLMSAVNFALQSDFRWFLALPPIGWFVALGLYVRAA
ncbi:hypothetical protein LJR296_007192 [Cupriavidus necator]|uniref:hypothetical protein n=1 Tax=Cupriavidus necator TaxID=106590 RepID=UPI003ED00DBB